MITGERRHHPKQIDIARGVLFGYLTVQEVTRDKRGVRAFRCECACGKTRTVIPAKLMSGEARSCGCDTSNTIAEVARKNNTTHGLCRSKIYNTWVRIKARCLNPNCQDYPDYGGRGVTLCDRWKNSFEAFRADVGDPPSNSYLTSIGRIHNDRGYEPGNCRWEVPTQQARNKRSTNRLTAFGETKTLPEWLADPRCVVTKNVLRRRVRADPDVDHEWALSHPSRKAPRASQ